MFEDIYLRMTVEIFLRKKDEPVVLEEDALPDSLIELEMMMKEIEWSISKLRESTDLLIEEFHKADKTEEPEAKEYYEYILDNRIILAEKSKLMEEVSRKMNQIRGIFKSAPVTESVSSGAGGMVEGHFI